MSKVLIGLLFFFSILSYAQEEEKFQETYEADTDTSVKIINVNGTVEIIAWEEKNIEVTAVKRGAPKNKNNWDRVSIEVRQSASLLRIRTIHPEQIGDIEVNYTICVPRDIKKIEAEISNGSLSVSGVACTTTATTKNGNIKVELTEVKNSRELTFQTTNGNIEAYLAFSLDARVRGKTTNGTITTEFSLNVRKNLCGASVDGVLNREKSSLSLTTVNGSIMIMRKP